MWKNSIIILLIFLAQDTLFAQPAYHGLNLEKAKALLQQARKKDREAAEILDSLRNLRWGYEELLGDAERKDLSKKERLQLEKDINDLKKQEAGALKHRKEADDRVREVEEMLTMTPDKLNKKIVAIEKKEGKINATFPETMPSDITDAPQTAKETIATQEPSKPKKKKEKNNKTKKETEPPTDTPTNVENNNAQNDTPPTTTEPTKEVVVAENQPITKEKKSKPNKKEKKKTPKKEEAAEPTQPVAQATENSTPTEGGKSEDVTTPPTENQTNADDEKEKKKKVTPKTSKTNIQYAKYDPLLDPSITPPRVPCAVAFEGKDAFTNSYKKELKSQMLFTHTEDFMRNALGNKEYITCKVQVTEVQGGYRYLNLNITIASREAQRSFGFVDKGSPIIFKLMNGTNVTLLNTKTDLGLVNTENNTTTYNLSMLINKNDSRSLQNSELDVVRVAWSAGYEDYNILWTDVLQDLFRCIEK